MRRLVCACIVRKFPKTGFLASRPRQYEPQRQKTCLRGFADNKGADQSVHPHRPIMVIVISILDRIISKLGTSEIPIVYHGDWFQSGFVEKPKDQFCHAKAHMRGSTVAQW